MGIQLQEIAKLRLLIARVIKCKNAKSEGLYSN